MNIVSCTKQTWKEADLDNLGLMMLVTCRGRDQLHAQKALNATAGAYRQYRQRLPGILFRSGKTRSMLIHRLISCNAQILYQAICNFQNILVSQQIKLIPFLELTVCKHTKNSNSNNILHLPLLSLSTEEIVQNSHWSLVDSESPQNNEKGIFVYKIQLNKEFFFSIDPLTVATVLFDGNQTHFGPTPNSLACSRLWLL